MAAMTPRQRVEAALHHQEPDRVPLDIGSGTSNSLVIEAYDRLKAYWGTPTPTRVMAETTRVAHLDEETMARLGSDFRPLRLRGPSRWTPPADADPDTLVTELGVRYRRARYAGGYYWELAHSPLAEATLTDVARFPWPDPDDPGRYAGVAEEAERLFHETPYALVGCSGYQTFWQALFALRGLEQGLIDLVANQELAHAILDRVYEISAAVTRRFLESAGPYLSVVRVADDLATQTSLLMSPVTYRRMIQPYHQRFTSLIRQYTDATIFLHCCGNFAPLMDDLLDAGFEAFHPVQVSALSDPAGLKARYGDRAIFWGGIDTQHVLPYGTPEDVRAEVRLRISQFAAGGGYIAGAVHNIQPDVPPANIVALCDAVRELGVYPLRDRM